MPSNTEGASYAAAGVDIEAGDRAVELMKDWVKKTRRPEVLGGLGGIKAARLVPGHGPVDAPWPAASGDTERYLGVLARDLRRSIAAGLSLTAALETAGQSEAGRWQLFDEYNRRNATGAFAELEWE